MQQGPKVLTVTGPISPLHGIRFCTCFTRVCTFCVRFYTFYALKHFGMNIFIRLDVHMYVMCHVAKYIVL